PLFAGALQQNAGEGQIVFHNKQQRIAGLQAASVVLDFVHQWGRGQIVWRLLNGDCGAIALSRAVAPLTAGEGEWRCCCCQGCRFPVRLRSVRLWTSRQRWWRRGSPAVSWRRIALRQVQREGAPLARHAYQPNLAAQEPRQLATNRQAQARAS